MPTPNLSQPEPEWDEKTGFASYARFMRLVEAQLAEANQEHRPLCMLGLDLDRFMMFNDTFGFKAGDAALGAVATILRLHFYAFDMNQPHSDMCRYNADSFLTTLPNTTRLAALNCAEQLRQAAISFPIGTKYGLRPDEHSLSFSIAVAAYPEDGNDAESLLNVVESGIYAAKRRGGNNVWTGS